jgi:hypothetical protein
MYHKGGSDKECLTALDWSTDHTTDAGTDTGGQNDKGERELLGLGFVDIGN